MELNEYHKKAINRKLEAVAYWRKHPMSREACLNQFKSLREQRIAREFKSMNFGNLPSEKDAR